MCSSSRDLALAAVIITLFLMFPSSAPAQEIGVKAGFNSASLTEGDAEPDISRRIGLIGGAWVRTPAASRFSFQVEGLFSEKGVKFEAFGLSSDIALRYLETPLLARAGSGTSSSAVRGFVVGGVAPAFKLSARGKAKFEGQEHEQDIGEDVNGFDLGLAGGGGIEFGRVVVEARYTHGLLHVNSDDNGDEDRINNRVFSVMFGFRFR